MGIAHLGHFEIRVTDLEASRRFFTDVVGLFESHVDDERAYLRAWQDWDHHTLVLKRGERSGLEHAGWRVESREDLNRYAQLFKKHAVDFEWLDEGQEPGQGEALRFQTPEGHPMELYSRMEKFVAEDESLVSPMSSHPSRYTGHGIAPRRIDHFGIGSGDVSAMQDWLNRVLGLKLRYYVQEDDGRLMGAWLSRTNLSHDVSVVADATGDGGNLHHIAYYLDSGEELLRGARVLVENGHEIEWGPGNHGTSGATFMYFFEPSGNRVEVWTGGMLIFDPDWEPIRWTPEEMSGALERWGSQPPDTWLTRLT